MASARRRCNNPIVEPLRIAVTTMMGWRVFHGRAQYANKLRRLGRTANNGQQRGGCSQTRECWWCISAPSTLECTWTSSSIGIFGNTAATADQPVWTMLGMTIMAGKTPTHGMVCRCWRGGKQKCRVVRYVIANFPWEWTNCATRSNSYHLHWWLRGQWHRGLQTVVCKRDETVSFPQMCILLQGVRRSLSSTPAWEFLFIPKTRHSILSSMTCFCLLSAATIL